MGFPGFPGVPPEVFVTLEREKKEKKRGPFPTPSRDEVVQWVARAFASITDDAIRDGRGA